MGRQQRLKVLATKTLKWISRDKDIDGNGRTNEPAKKKPQAQFFSLEPPLGISKAVAVRTMRYWEFTQFALFFHCVFSITIHR